MAQESEWRRGVSDVGERVAHGSELRREVSGAGE